MIRRATYGRTAASRPAPCRSGTLLLLAAAAGMMASCRTETAPQPAPGRLRIVSLAPNVTEILFALGLGDNIIGATDRCDYPPAARKIPRVCGFGAPNVETLLAMAPDVVIACGVEKPELLEVLRRSGIRVVNAQKTAFMTSFPELFDAIREIGEATGHADEARALAARMESDLRQVDAEVDRIDGARRPRVFIEIEENPLMTASAGSFLDELITRAGGRNVARDIPGGYPRIDPEKVVEWDPEVILVAHSDRPGEATGRFRRRIGWSGVAAVRDGRIIDDVNPDLLFRPGPRLVDGVKALAARLHGN